MKAVMISIKPKWVEKIVSGEKTVEVRKSAPKLERPFYCFIYCTKETKKGEPISYMLENGKYFDTGKVIGEFVCDWIFQAPTDVVTPLTVNMGICGRLTPDELLNYGKGKPLCGLFINNLKLYDKPKEINEFKVACNPKLCLSGCESVHLDNYFRCINQGNRRLTRPPQSWCYVEVEE